MPLVLPGVVGTLVGGPIDRDQGDVKDGEDAEAAARPGGSLVGDVGWRCVILSVVGALAWWVS